MTVIPFLLRNLYVYALFLNTGELACSPRCVHITAEPRRRQSVTTAVKPVWGFSASVKKVYNGVEG